MAAILLLAIVFVINTFSIYSNKGRGEKINVNLIYLQDKSKYLTQNCQVYLYGTNITLHFYNIYFSSSCEQ